MDWQSENYGGSLKVTLTADGYKLSTPSGVPGSARFFDIVPDVPRVLLLPFGAISRPGEHLTVWNHTDTQVIAFVDQGLTTVGYLLPNEVAKLWLRGSPTVAGSWAMKVYSGAAGTETTYGRVPLDYRITSDSVDFNLRSYWDSHGYDGSTPAALRCWIGSEDYTYAVGASSTDGYGFDSGDWPEGTTLLLINHAVVSGRGGKGGRGGSVPPGLLSGDGLPGGTAMRLSVDTALVNLETIQAGGGGGGGGSEGAGIAGGGGGGGAGHVSSEGGAAGLGGGAIVGYAGSLYGPGAGGGGWVSGAYGGDPGTDGNGKNSDPSYPGGYGGLAGKSIIVKAGATLTKIRTGIITGAEDTF